MQKEKHGSEGPQIGYRISESREYWSHSRYKVAVTPQKSESYGKFHKNTAPNLRQKSFTALGPRKDALIKKMPGRKNISLRSINGYVPAKLTTGKRWYVEFYCYHPEKEKLHRCRVSVPPIKKASERRAYAKDMEVEINERLKKGYNPFMSLNNPKEYGLFDDACSSYLKYLYKMMEDGLMRIKTYNGYLSFLNRFRAWNAQQRKPVTYMYQFKKDIINAFLDYLWMDAGKSARTRDNYLGWFRSFVAYLMEKNFISEDPTANITMVQGKKKYQKNRTTIPKECMVLLKDHLEKNDRHFLLGCYVLYYCFIRPKEMTFIKLKDISVKNGTIYIAPEVSKNGKGSVVTLPDCVLKLMVDLGVLNYPSDWYLFSDDFIPGVKYRSGKQFTDAWTKVRKHFGWPEEYKFYSLKDTGITDMIRDNTDLLAVRDQARHHSLEMTNLYTPMESKEANETIRHRQSYF